MIQSKKLMLVALALLALVALPLVGCKNDSVSEGLQVQNLTFTSATPTALITTYYDSNGSLFKTKPDVPDMDYSTDGRNWTRFTAGQQDIHFGSGIQLYLRGKSEWGTAKEYKWDTATNDSSVNFTFKEGTKVYASGDIRTLVDWENPTTVATSNARFTNLFSNCDELVTAPELPATKLVGRCYDDMFNGCKKLASVTMLATNLVTNYSGSSGLKDWLGGVANNGTLTVANETMVNNDTIKASLPESWRLIAKTN